VYVHMKLPIVNSTKDSNNTESNMQQPSKQCFIRCHKNLLGTNLVHSKCWILRYAYVLQELIFTIPSKQGYAVAQSVEALHYKPESRRFNSQWGNWASSLT